jgi:hypothetical protein
LLLSIQRKPELSFIQVAAGKHQQTQWHAVGMRANIWQRTGLIQNLRSRWLDALRRAEPHIMHAD